MRERGARSLAVAALFAAFLVGTAGVAPARAADDALSIVSNASYTLVPAKGVIRVTVDVTARNNKPNLVRETPNGTLTTRYFFESASIAIHAEAASVRATAGGARLSTKVRRDEGFTVLEVRFRSDLFFGKSTKFRVQYDLPGGAPRSNSDIRVGSAFATFYAWAFGDRGNVRINVPAGFEVETSGEAVETTVRDGVTTLSATAVDEVNEWYVVVVADRRDALTTERLDLAGGEHLVVRAWPEDKDWQSRVADLLRVGMPVLAQKIGLDWPVSGDIEVAEVHTPLLEGYAGVFYTREDRIEISEDLDELTIIHEASHAWFNPALFVGRWINEGFADEYAARVLDEVSIGGLRPESVSPTSPGAVRLNDWRHPGRIDDADTSARERFGYEASWTVIRTLVEEIGEEGMRGVLRAADAKEVAYVGAAPPERVSVTNDWRRLLDLLEERGGSRQAQDLFRRWIVVSEDEELLDVRASARAAYAALVEAGRGWLPGYVIRDPLGRWQFEQATREIAAATEILAIRDEIERIAAGVGAAPAPALEAAYEAAAEDLDRVRGLAAKELEAISALELAAARVRDERGLLTTIGLIGEDPAAGVAAASAAFSAGDHNATARGTAAVGALLDKAPETGRTRVIAGGVVGIGAGAAGVAGVVALRRRRRAAEPQLLTAAEPPPAMAAEPQPLTAAEPPPAMAAIAEERTSDPSVADPAEGPGTYATLGDPAAAESADAGPAERGRDEGDDS